MVDTKLNIDIASEPIGAGGSRICYPYPGGPDKCIKVHRSPEMLINRKLMRTFRAWLAGKFSLFNLNWHEYRFWQKYIQNNKIPELRVFLPHFHQLAKTGLGLALILECVRDDNGRISESLKSWYPKASRSDRNLALEQIDALKNIIVDHGLPCYDWNPNNFLVQYTCGRFQLKLIDFEAHLGNNELIPLSTFIPRLRRAKVRRRIERGLLSWLKQFED